MSDSSAPRTYKLYQYAPSLAAAVVFCLLFCITTLFHAWQMIRRKTWFLISFVIGGFFEFVGYACRATSAQSPPGQYRLMPFVIQNSFILIAPALFAATIYMILGRIIKLTDGDQHSIVKHRTVTKFFLIGDVFCFALQAGGGSLMAVEMTKPNSSSAKTGSNMILAGVALQLIWFVFFVIVSGLFQWRMRSVPTATVQSRPDIRWQRYLGLLYFVSTMIVIRSVFRLAEYAQGYDGYIQSKEVFLYIFDSLPMFIVMVWMNWQHPGEVSLLLRGEELKNTANTQTELDGIRGGADQNKTFRSAVRMV